MSTEIILDSVANLFSSEELLSICPEDLSDCDALLVWSLFDALEKEVLSKRKSVFRDRLFAIAEKNGEKNAKGSHIYSPSGSDGKITKQFRKGKPIVNWDAVQKLADETDTGSSLREGVFRADEDTFAFIIAVLEEHDAGDLLDRTLNLLHGVKYEFSEKRLERAVEVGLVSLDELQSVTTVSDPTYALVVKKPTVVKQLLERGKK